MTIVALGWCTAFQASKFTLTRCFPGLVPGRATTKVVGGQSVDCDCSTVADAGRTLCAKGVLVFNQTGALLSLAPAALSASTAVPASTVLSASAALNCWPHVTCVS